MSLRFVTRCVECGTQFDNRLPGEICQENTRTDVGLRCYGEVHLADAGVMQMLGEVLLGVHGDRCRYDIMTDIAGSREAVTDEIRAFVNATCDLLGYLKTQAEEPR